PAITVKYPYEKLERPERFRGSLAFHPEVCTSCELCVKACPSECIRLSWRKNEKGKRVLDWYEIDFAKCNYCRLCEEACPTTPKSVHHTNSYELTFRTREDFIVRWEHKVDEPLRDFKHEEIHDIDQPWMKHSART
ncbi:MAG: NADH-quinone oxidoreductase subunit I, partial [bacterium]|nr:NADH-quinone oxidoreductase subunit I [bacterium]